MEQIIDNLTEIKKFVNEHTDVLENEDYLYMYKNTTIDRIKQYLVDNGHVILNDNQYVTTLKTPNKKDILIKLLDNDSVSINSENKGKTILDNTIIEFIDEMINKGSNIDDRSYYEYIIFILSKGCIGKLSVIYDIIKELDGNNIDNITEIYKNIVDLIDLLLLYKSEIINIEKSNELYSELFKNMGKDDIKLSDNLTSLLKDNSNFVSVDIMNNIEDKNKEGEHNIVKISKNEKYILYEEDNIRWVFNEDDVKKILETKINPYTNKIILDDTIEMIKNNYKIDF